MKNFDPTQVAITDETDPTLTDKSVKSVEDKESPNPNDLMRQMDSALQFGTDESLLELFDSGMAIDQTDFQDRTALMLLTSKGNRAVAEVLIERGADVNCVYMYQDRIPMTALDAATQTGRADLADVLRTYGAMSGRELKRVIDEAHENDAELLNLLSVQFTAALAEAPVYRKNTIVTARLAVAGEVIVTLTPSGVEESRNTANDGDYVVTGANGADFILPSEKFTRLYEVTEDDSSKYQSRGMARIIDNPIGKKIGILAPWGSMAYGGEDSKIAVQYDPIEPDVVGTDRYILDKDEFAAYKPLEVEA